MSGAEPKFSKTDLREIGKDEERWAVIGSGSPLAVLKLWFV
jgi:hypothetical protein